MLVDDVRLEAEVGPVLTVVSIPSSGASVVVSPADLNSDSDGATQFTRQYGIGSSVTLTAPAAYGGLEFERWKIDGEDLTVSLSANFTMDANHTLTAVYMPVLNGSFEVGTLLTGDGEPGDPGDFADLANWNAVGNSVGYIDDGSWTASEGERLALFNSGGNDYSGAISQSFPTVVGQDYLLEFDVGIYRHGGQAAAARRHVRRHRIIAGGRAGEPHHAVARQRGAVDVAERSAGLCLHGKQHDHDDHLQRRLQFCLAAAWRRESDLLLDNVSVTETTITGVPAVAVADAYATDEDAALVVPALTGVLANDTDADLDPLTAVLVGDVADGVLALASDGSFTYTPDADFNGADSFTYLANGGGQDSNTVTVALTVNAVDDAPVAVAENYAATVDTLLTVVAPGVLANDTDAELDALTAVLVDDVANGTLALASNGSFTYQPDAAYEGADSFTYKANGGGQDSNVVTVSLTVSQPGSNLLVNGSFEIGTLLTGDGEPGDPGDFADLANWNAAGNPSASSRRATSPRRKECAWRSSTPAATTTAARSRSRSRRWSARTICWSLMRAS